MSCWLNFLFSSTRRLGSTLRWPPFPSASPAHRAAVYRSHPNANQTGDDHAVTAKWTLTGVRLTDEGVFSATGNSVGVATVGVAHSVSKPVDFEFSDEVQVTLAAEVVVKLMHDDDGSPNASIPAAAGPDYGGQNWTAFALPVATQRLNFAIVDSPVSARAVQPGSDRSCSCSCRGDMHCCPSPRGH